jgi:hypothetical protein
MDTDSPINRRIEMRYLPPLTGGGDAGFVIRAAEPSDLVALVEMGAAFFKETGHESRGLVFDPLSFLQTMQLLGDHGMILVVERNGRTVGMGAIDAATAFWNRSIVLAREAFWYLQPDHRVGQGGRLLQALEDLARSKGAVFFDGVAEEGPRAEALGRLYRAAGYQRAEVTYRKNLSNSDGGVLCQ